jgi:hypothetical protein
MTNPEIDELIRLLSNNHESQVIMDRIDYLKGKWKKHYKLYDVTDSRVKEFYDKSSPNYAGQSKY